MHNAVDISPVAEAKPPTVDVVPKFWSVDAVQLRASHDPVLDNELLMAYQRDGFVRIKGALTQDEIAGLRSAVDVQTASLFESAGAYDFQEIAEQVWAGKRKLDAHSATRFNMSRFHKLIAEDPQARPLLETPEFGAPKGRFFYEAAGWRRFAEIRTAALDSALPEIAAAVMESGYVNFWEDTTFVKTPGATQRTAFHQDLHYFQISGRKCCIIWIALDSVDESSGALEYVRGSHLWGEEYAPNLLISSSIIPESRAPRLPDIEADKEAYDIVSIPAEAGDIVIHDVRAVHGSAGNKTSNKMRRAISLRYCGDDIRYCEKPGAIKQPFIGMPPQDGEPLQTVDYPRVWPRPYPGAKISRLYE
jgi:hypothetical protein